MNPIETVASVLRAAFPDLRVELDRPGDPAGNWVLDVARGEVPVLEVEWRPARGMGISSVAGSLDDFGSAPDEVYPEPAAAIRRIFELLATGERTEPPPPVRLAELRRQRGMTQDQVAARVGIKRAALSRLENRTRLNLETIRRVVGAMGARVEVHAIFPDGSSRLVELGDGASVATTDGGGHPNRMVSIGFEVD